MAKKTPKRVDYHGFDIPFATEEIKHFPGYGMKDAPEGTQDFYDRLHLELYTKVPVVDKGSPYLDTHNSVSFQWELERFNSNLLKAHDCQLWMHLKDGDGHPFKAFKDYLIYKQPWGLGMGGQYDLLMKMLRAYVPTQTLVSSNSEEHQVCAADVIETAVRDGREFCGGDHKSEEFKSNILPGEETCSERDRVKGNQEERARAIARCPLNIRHLYQQELIAQKLACRFGVYVPEKPSAAQVERADAAAAAAQRVERWVEANPVPLIRGDLTAYKMRLRGICEEAIGSKSNRVEIQVASPKTAADQMLRRLDRDFLRQLITLLQEAV